MTAFIYDRNIIRGNGRGKSEAGKKDFRKKTLLYTKLFKSLYDAVVMTHRVRAETAKVSKMSHATL